MVYLTGDIHGDPERVVQFCLSMKPRRTDTIILLGDVAANYTGGQRDEWVKQTLEKLKINILCIHGNHEMRPSTIESYKLKEWRGGMVWYEEAYPHLLFAKDGEIYTIEGKSYLAIGGAYSVDKFYRLERNYGWWSDEQPSEEIKKYVESQIDKVKCVDYVLSHTCPFKYEPREAFLKFIDQSTVGDSTERWLDVIEEKLEYKLWFCGHWHIDKRIDKMHFLFKSFEGQ